MVRSTIATRRFGVACCLVVLVSTVGTAAPEIVSVKKIWDQGAHNAFTDLARFHDQWFCTFREAERHDGVRRRGEARDQDDGESGGSERAHDEARGPRPRRPRVGHVFLRWGGRRGA